MIQEEFVVGLSASKDRGIHKSRQSRCAVALDVRGQKMQNKPGTTDAASGAQQARAACSGAAH